MNNQELLELFGTDPYDCRAQLAELSGEQFSWLSRAQLSRLSRAQLSGLSRAQLSGLSGEQLSWLSRAQLSGLSRGQLSWLSRAQLSWLSGEQLSWLSGAQLSELSRAQLADLSGEQLSWLSRAQLSWLSGGQLEKIEKINAVTPRIEKPYTKLLKATNDCTLNFDMKNWHCNTTHCAAGTIVDLAGEAGYELEEMFDTPIAARMILRKSCPPNWPLPNFYATNESATAFIKKMARLESELQA